MSDFGNDVCNFLGLCDDDDDEQEVTTSATVKPPLSCSVPSSQESVLTSECSLSRTGAHFFELDQL